MTTKADLITPEELAALDRTPLGYRCTGCGLMLHTEGDFARHFTLIDRVHLNLGNCPRKALAKPGRRLHDTYEAEAVDGHLREFTVIGLNADGSPRSYGFDAKHSSDCRCYTSEDW